MQIKHGIQIETLLGCIYRSQIPYVFDKQIIASSPVVHIMREASLSANSVLALEFIVMNKPELVSGAGQRNTHKRCDQRKVEAFTRRLPNLHHVALGDKKS